MWDVKVLIIEKNFQRCLEVSRVGILESDYKIELSLELSIGGSYGKFDKLKQGEDSGKEEEKV